MSTEDKATHTLTKYGITRRVVHKWDTGVRDGEIWCKVRVLEVINASPYDDVVPKSSLVPLVEEPEEKTTLKAYSYSFAATYADGGYVFGTVAAKTVGEARKLLLRHFREQGHTGVKEGDLRILQPSVAIEPGAILVTAERA